MRLSAIKLAGFKSFVEPTTIALPGDLTGVIGPNGCGKSNVIDAVRWVTGESSARQLRGEALADVIFAGTKTRKPVGRASVELIFDNADGALGGPYAGFAEISVRREQSRQAGSTYFINGSRARRRDVVDVFLGTGLGGRNSYAIIGQGAVNRLIDARPEELREVLEEAAGISRYKERRRETESRIGQTRDNLAQLAERIEAAEQRLDRLEKQAEAAASYRELAAEQRRLERGRLALRWARWRDRASAADRQRETARAAEAAALADQRAAQAERDACEAARKQAAEAVDARQAAYYDAQAEAQRVRQAIDYAEQLQKREQRERDALGARRAELVARRDGEAAAETDADQRLAGLTARLASARAAESDAENAASAADQAAAAAETERDALVDADDNPARALERERQRAADARQRLDNLAQQRRARAGERDALGDADDAGLDAARHRLAECERERERADRRRARDAAHLESCTAAFEAGERALAERQTRAGETRAALAAHSAFERSASGADSDALADWLARHAGPETAPAGDCVRVRGDWRGAADAALGAWLGARVVAKWPDLEAAAPPPEPLTLVTNEPDQSAAETARTRAGAPSLATGLTAPPALRTLAADFFVVETRAAAEAGRGELAAHERFVTRDGVCIGPASVGLPADAGAEAGPLARARQGHALRLRLAADDASADAARAALDARREARDRAAARQAESEAAIATQQRVLSTERADYEGARQRAAHARTRAAELDAELADVDARYAQTEDERRAAERCAAELGERAEGFEQQRRACQQTLMAAREQREAARTAHADTQRQRREVEAERERASAERDRGRQRRADSQRALDDVDAELAALTERDNDDASQAPSAADLESARAAFAAAETALREARTALADAEQALSTAGQRLMQSENELGDTREALQSAAVELESAVARRAGAAEQLAEAEPERAPAAVAAELPADADADRWQAELARVEARIEALGAINLAAIDEFEAERERDRYLRAQYRDIDQALATLLDAIDKIDRETRAQFKTVFDDVDARFGQLFAELFGGGEARLARTEADWLAAGVQVRARPPGKPAVALSMLSGGEKALTAIALLFALFERNPAPFCMLDEIDAPLDDANVARFCELLRRMSAQVQFVVITHNKVTMELPEQLHGVTMAESGVSRLVSVDVDAALRLAG